MNKRARLSIFGADEIAREGLRLLLSGKGFTAEALRIDQPAETLGRLRDGPDHIVVIDIASEQDAFDFYLVVRRHLPASRVVMMLEGFTVAMLRRLIVAGVDGVLMRDTPCDPLVGMLNLVAMGEKVVPSDFIEHLASSGPGVPGALGWVDLRADTNLSEREAAILQCVVNGDANKMIAQRLSIAEATVKVHIKSIMRKLHATNRTQAAIWAIRQGLVHQGAGELVAEEE